MAGLQQVGIDSSRRAENAFAGGMGEDRGHVWGRRVNDGRPTMDDGREFAAQRAPRSSTDDRGSDGLVRLAYAKINLCLEIIGKREDNYHNIVSVMQLVDLSDMLTFFEGDELTLACDNVRLAEEGDGNLILKTARLLQEAGGVQRGAHIELEKRIPLAAGLGGGSSDAAAALRGLSELWGLRAGREDLMNLAIQLGSDVPFFLAGPTALVEGRGERVTKNSVTAARVGCTGLPGI